MSNIREATDDNFQDLVINSEKPVIVDFWAAWCGPCRLVAPEIDKLAEKYAGSVEVVKLDVDANPHTAMHYGIMSIPTVAFFAPGQPPRAAVGFRPAEQLEAAFSLDSLTALPPSPPVETPPAPDRTAEPIDARSPVERAFCCPAYCAPCAPASLDGQPPPRLMGWPPRRRWRRLAVARPRRGGRRWRPGGGGPGPLPGAARRASHPRDDRRGGHLAGAGYARRGRSITPGITFAVQAGASNIAASSGGQSIGARVESADDDFTAIEVTFGRGVFYRQSYPYTVSFDLVDPGGAGTRDLRIGSSLAAFPVWAFGTQGEPGGSVRVELPQGYAPNVQGSAMTEGELPGGGVLLSAQLGRPARLLRLRLGGATRRLRQQDDEPGRPRHACPAADPRLGRRSGVGSSR